MQLDVNIFPIIVISQSDFTLKIKFTVLKSKSVYQANNMY